jgi:Polyketide cyclase / dehydrase and lipid transport
MQRLHTSIVISSPIETIFTYITDMEYFKQWASVFRSKQTVILPDGTVEHATLNSPLRQVIEGPLQVGTTFVQSNDAPDPIDATIEVIVYEPPYRFAVKRTSTLMKGYVKWDLEPINGETRLTKTIEAEAEGAFLALFSLFSFFSRKSAQQQLDQNLLGLKRQMEDQS